MASTLRLCFLVGAVAAVAPAQNATVPAVLNALEGGTGTAIPFGLSSPVRVQYIYDREDLPWSGPRLISRVSLRADNSSDNTTAFASKGFVFVSLLLSTTHVRAETASGVFENNWGTDAVLVIDNVPMMLPAQPAMAGPRPANIDFVLPVPWFYGLTPARGPEPAPTSLLVEIRVHSQPTGTYRLDNIGNCAIAPVLFGQRGALCQSVGGSPIELVAGPSLVAGAAYSWQVHNADPQVPAVLLLGTMPQTLFGGHPALPLPVPMFDPTNPALPPPVLGSLLVWPYPAPDCWLNVAPTELMIGAADGQGSVTFTIVMSPARSLVGLPVFAQALVYSQTANAMQMVSSLGVQSTVCGPLGVGRVYALGSATATTGQAAFGQGAVIELH